MQRTEVKSSAIKSIGYDAAQNILEIEFKGGGVYQYSDFPQKEWDWFRLQPSIGGHFAKNIANKYKSKRVEEYHAENSTEAPAAKE